MRKRVQYCCIMATAQMPHLAAIEEQDQNLHGSEELGVMSHFQARNHWTGLEELSRAYTPLELRPRWSGRTRYSTSNGGPFSNRPAHLVPTTHEVIYGNILGVWTPLPRQEHVTGTRPGACPSFQTTGTQSDHDHSRHLFRTLQYSPSNSPCNPPVSK
jgi:hypothetical protein